MARARSKVYVGLEIGTAKVAMAVAEVQPNHSVRILGIGSVPSKGVQKGEISDQKLVTECVQAALVEAEQTSQVTITTVMLALTGAHFKGVNHEGVYRLPDHKKEVEMEHIDEVVDSAKDLTVNRDRSFIHHLPKRFLLDGQEHTTPPYGLCGQTLEKGYHIVHGLAPRFQNSVKLVRQLGLEVKEVVFSPVASAQIALRKGHKAQGALLIDVGAGTTEYILFVDSQVEACGCLPYGGDNITQDIRLVMNVNPTQAEHLKLHEATAYPSEEDNLGTIKLLDNDGEIDAEVRREQLNEVVNDRVSEILTMVRDRLPGDWSAHLGAGVFLTGGSSQMRGIENVAHDTFEKPIFFPAPSKSSEEIALYEDPQFATVLGLVRWAQFMDQEMPLTMKEKFQGVARSFWPF